MRHTPNAFWRFSLATYADAGVAAACLSLQDRWRADVNLLLYCCWLGRDGRTLDRQALRSAMAHVKTLQREVIGPLRCSRRSLKHPPPGVPKVWAKQLKNRIAAIELDLEYVEHRVLLAAAKRLRPAVRRVDPRTAIAANLDRYLSLLEMPRTHPDRRHVRRLLLGCAAALPAPAGADA